MDFERACHSTPYRFVVWYEMTYSPRHTLPPALTATHITMMYQSGQYTVELPTEVAPSEIVVLAQEQRLLELTPKVEALHRLPQGDALLGSAILKLAVQQDAPALAVLLQATANTQNTMLAFWMALVQHDPNTLAWMGRHDDVARHFFLPMPCPNREWILENHANREDPIPHFVRWWRHFPTAWRTAIVDHLRVEWHRRFVGQSKLYWLLDKPTLEQAEYVSTLPQPVYDWPLLEQIIPNAFTVVRMLQELQPNPKALRAEWIATLAQRHQPQEMYTLPTLP